MIIYNVFCIEEYVGNFYQASFSTKEIAEEYIKINIQTGDEFYIKEHKVDSA